MKRLLFTIILILVTSNVFAQNYSQAVKFLQQFKQVNEQAPRESVYLHTDRDWYFHGERIWFSAYLKVGGYIPSNLSNVLYVELVEPDGRIADRVLLKLENGRTNGNLSLEGVKKIAGNFEIRAYTKWGLNFGPSYEFTKPIKVIVKGEENKISATNKFDVQFFPESGHLVEDIPTKLAFKAIDGNGMGLDISGSIYDQNDNKVINFESAHLGMGALSFTPEDDNSYYAMVEDKRFDLPVVKKEGVLINVTQKGDFINLRFKASDELKSNPYLMFAHVRGTIFEATPVDLEAGINSITIPSSKFPSGIINFTLIEGNTGQTITERSVFNKNPIDHITVNLSASKQGFESREPVDLSIETYNADNERVNSIASIAVFDDGIETYDPNQTDIRTHFLLESELNGHVEDPGFYFSDDDSASAYLDYLMLTQGWKAYKMNNLVPPEDERMVSNPEKAIEISGSIKTLIRNRPIEDATLFASVMNNEDLKQITTTDSTGSFIITGLDFYGRKPLSIKANNDGSDKVWIEIDDQFDDLPFERDEITQYPLFPPRSVDLPSNAQNLAILQQRSDNALEQSEDRLNVQMSGDLGEISVEGKRDEDEDFSDRILGNLSGRGTEIYVQEKEHMKNLPIDMMLNQIPGVTANAASRSIVLRTGTLSFNSGRLPASIYVDGMATDASFVFSLSSSEIEKITVARSAVDLAAFGAGGAGGVISIKTLTGVTAFDNDRGLKAKSILGYQEPSEFYAPKYGVTVPSDYERRDSRITLHWNPTLYVSSEVSNNIRFWMNDIPSSYRIVVQGLTETGDPFTYTSLIRQN